MWTYESPIGTLAIIQDAASRLFYIRIGGNHYGSYRSADAAASDVYTFTTGCDDWDMLQLDDEINANAPAELSDWNRY